MKRITIQKILKKKGKEKITCLTAYSKTTSQILDKYCDIILVGDSVGMTLYGMKSTKKVSLDTLLALFARLRLAMPKISLSPRMVRRCCGVLITNPSPILAVSTGIMDSGCKSVTEPVTAGSEGLKSFKSSFNLEW